MPGNDCLLDKNSTVALVWRGSVQKTVDVWSCGAIEALTTVDRHSGRKNGASRFLVPDHGVCCPFSAGRARPSGRGVGAPCLLPPRLPRTSCPSRAYNGCHVRSAALLTRHPHVQRRIMRVESVCGELHLPLGRGSRALTAQHLTNLGCRFIVQPPGLSGSFSSMGDSAGLGQRCGRTETWRWHTT
jgi:hypothetical protein